MPPYQLKYETILPSLFSSLDNGTSHSKIKNSVPKGKSVSFGNLLRLNIIWTDRNFTVFIITISVFYHAIGTIIIGILNVSIYKYSEGCNLMANKKQAACPTIIGLEFGEESLKTIETINQMHTSATQGWIVTTIGHLGLIFAGLVLSPGRAIPPEITAFGAKPILKVGTDIVETAGSASASVSYNIYQTNWEIFFKGVGAFDKIARKKIEEAITYQAMKKQSPKERIFWRTMDRGCKVES